MNDQRQCILGKGGLFLVAPMICDARGIRTEVPSSKDPRFASGIVIVNERGIPEPWKP